MEWLLEFVGAPQAEHVINNHNKPAPPNSDVGVARTCNGIVRKEIINVNVV